MMLPFGEQSFQHRANVEFSQLRVARPGRCPKSQKSAMLAVSLGAAMKCFQLLRRRRYRLDWPRQRGKTPANGTTAYAGRSSGV